ncbi:site-specific DNA-methyltransferase [Streptomyces lydicus]|uniref:site-specific DNA-methyltransferase n=1 Tax=Streptomyces lydicus TaxID=47763 RepID=UPI00333182B1
MTEPYYRDPDGTVELYLGDNRELLPALALQADLIVTDPPYEETSHQWDRWPAGWLDVAAATSRSMWCFGGLRMFMRHAPEFAAAGWKLSHDTVGKDEVDVEAIWEKHNASGPNADRFRRIHEQAGHFYQGLWRDTYREPQRTATGVVERGRVVRQGAKEIGHRGEYATGSWTDNGTRLLTSVLRYRSMHRRGGIHPCEKPVPMLDRLIRYGCRPGGLVVDPFAGSASTLDAARRAGRRAIGIEGDEGHAEAAALRLAEPLNYDLFGEAA